MHLSLTIDYELYGDGSGDVFKTMIHPLNSYLDLLNKHQIKSTIFFEVLEYIKMKEAYTSGVKMGYNKNPVEAIENQIKAAYNDGHDIQLHLHPQWGAANFKINKWVLDNSYWRLSSVPEKRTDNYPYTIKELIELGKKAIEKIVDAPKYDCNVFRAGGYNIAPSNNILEILRNLNFLADSSVVPGAVAETGLSRYNYSNIPNDIPYWYPQDCVEKITFNNRKEFVEIPLHSQTISRWKKYSFNRILVALKNKKSNLNKIKNNVGRKNSYYDKIKFFLEKEAVTWDYCLFSYSQMMNYYKYAQKIGHSAKTPYHPFVLIGHSKEYSNGKVLKRFIETVKRDVKFETMHEMACKLTQNA